MQPVAKHDLNCEEKIFNAITHSTISGPQSRAIDTVADLASTVQSSLASQSPPSVQKLASLYTYGDAPTNPKQLSGRLSVGVLVKRPVLVNLTRDCVVGQCRVGVFTLRQCANDLNRRRNSEAFIAMVQYLLSNGLALYLPTDSAGRSCFISPRSDYYPRGENSDHAFHVLQ
jgi:hypothetical protein